MLFFGRAEETQRLASLIFSEKLTVLYGKSGCGKSSLLQAGVLPRLREENQRGGVNMYLFQSGSRIMLKQRERGFLKNFVSIGKAR